MARFVRGLVQPWRWIVPLAALCYLLLPAAFAGHMTLAHHQVQASSCDGAPESHGHEPGDEHRHCDLCRFLGTLVQSAPVQGASEAMPLERPTGFLAILCNQQAAPQRHLPPALCPRGPPVR